MENNSLEIYRQRYETFRHLDKLRWQMLQILVAIASATALVLRSSQTPVEWWFGVLVGIALMITGFVMLRIGSGIRGNNKTLKEHADAIGDTGIPSSSNPWHSLAHWIAVGTLLVGALLVAGSIWMELVSGVET